MQKTIHAKFPPGKLVATPAVQEKVGGDYAMAARRYRLYAEELRAIADDDSVEASASKLRSVADDYERMAASMEAVANSYEKLSRV